ncbi:MAG TPA: hypothetical protein VFV17_04460, partial [Usitatibacteraceae bacterium]|nr:hypothetical protein [Usitatibacteraceae bacterium]
MKNIKFLWVLAALLLPASVHAEGSRSAKEISQILFPETKAWQEFDALPKLTPQSLSAIRGQLLRALNASKHGKELVEKCGIE